MREQIFADAADAGAGLIGREVAPVQIFAADFVVEDGENFVLERAAFAASSSYSCALRRGGRDNEKLERARGEISSADGGGEFATMQQLGAGGRELILCRGGELAGFGERGRELGRLSKPHAGPPIRWGEGGRRDGSESSGVLVVTPVSSGARGVTRPTSNRMAGQ